VDDVMERTGLYIAVDGPDGSGKSTLVSFAAEQLRSRFKSVVTLAEPERDAPLWPVIRDHRLSGEFSDDIWTLVLAAASLGSQKRCGGMLDRIADGSCVITDRSPLSFVAHYFCAVDRSLFEALLVRFRRPDILFLLQPDNPELLRWRLRNRGESETDIEQDCSVWKNYEAAGDWMVQLGWNVQPLTVSANKPVHRLWAEASKHILPLDAR
jgi:dTMP kinase